MLRSSHHLSLILDPIPSFVHAFLFFFFSPIHSCVGIPQTLWAECHWWHFFWQGRGAVQKGRLSPFALYARKFLGLNSQFVKVPVLTLGSQYPQIASLVVRSKWSVNTPGNSSCFCSDPCSKMLERWDNSFTRSGLHCFILLACSPFSPPWRCVLQFWIAMPSRSK